MNVAFKKGYSGKSDSHSRKDRITLVLCKGAGKINCHCYRDPMPKRPSAKILMALLALSVVLGVAFRIVLRKPAPGSSTNRADQELVRKVEQLRTREDEMVRRFGAKELLADKCGRVFEEFW